MANLDSSSVNPWSSNSTVLGLQLGDPQGGLVLARRHGLIPEQWQEGRDESVTSTRSSNCSSIRMIHRLQEISRITCELRQIELELHSRLVDRDTADLMHLDILKSRLSRIDSLLNHFTAVVSNKETVLSRLQSKAADNSLRIEAPFQRHAANVLTSLGSFVSDLPVNCEKVKWTSELDIGTTPLEEIMSEATESLVQCKSEYQCCQQLHDTMKQDFQ